MWRQDVKGSIGKELLSTGKQGRATPQPLGRPPGEDIRSPREASSGLKEGQRRCSRQTLVKQELGLSGTLQILAGERCLCTRVLPSLLSRNYIQLMLLHDEKFDGKTASLLHKALKMRNGHLKIRLSQVGQKSPNRLERPF